MSFSRATFRCFCLSREKSILASLVAISSFRRGVDEIFVLSRLSPEERSFSFAIIFCLSLCEHVSTLLPLGVFP